MTGKSSVKCRIKEFLLYKGIGQSKFEKNCGLSNGYVNNIKNGIGSAILEKILTTYPELSRTWLVTGEGEMLVSSPVHHNTITIDASGDTATASGDNSVALTGSNAQYNASGDAAEIKRLEDENKSLKAQLKEKDAQIASLHTIIANITTK